MGEVLSRVEAKEILGYHGIKVLRRGHLTEPGFITIMTFDSLQSVIDFQSMANERCYVRDVAQKVLERWDLRSAQYEVLETRESS